MNFKYLFFLTLIASTADADENPLTQFIDNAQYELDLTATGYFKTPPATNADRDDAAFLGRFTIKSQSYLSDKFSAGFNLYGAYSTQEHQYYGYFRNPGHRSRQPRFVDFNTAWLRYEADDFELILGKDYIETGLSEMYSPSDRFGLYNLSNPSQTYKIGVWQAGIDYFLGDDTLSLKVMPVHEKSLIPSESSRWLGNTDDPEFTALASNYEIKESYRPVRIENVGYLLQYKGSREGYDFFALAHHGPSIYPTLQQGAALNQRNKVDPLAMSVAAGVLKVIEQWKLYAEVIYQHSYSDRDEDFIRYAAGIGYSDNTLANFLGLNQINVGVQWSGDETVDAADPNKVDTRSREARPFRNTVFAKIEIEHNHEWGYFLSAIHNIEADFGLFGGAEYKPNDNLTFRLEGAFFDGPDDTHFGRWEDNDYLRLRTIYKF